MNQNPNDPQKQRKPTQQPGKVFDVRRPGTGIVPSTSKPVIVGHKPKVRDSVVVKKDHEDSPMLESTKKVEIKPFFEAPEKPEAKAIVAPTPELAAVAAELAASSDAPAEPTEQKEVPVPVEVPGPDESSVPDPQPDNPDTETQGASPAEEAEAAETDGIEAPELDASGPEEEMKPETTTPPKDNSPAPLTEQVPGLEQRTKREGVGVPAQPVKPGSVAQPEAEAETKDVDKNDKMVIDKDSIVVSKGGAPSLWKLLLWMLAVLITLIIVGDILLDAGVIYSSVPIPHTHIIN